MKSNKFNLLVGTLSSAFILVANTGMAVGKDLQEVCASSNSTCDAIAFTSNIIIPTYELDSSKVEQQLNDLGWKNIKPLDHLSFPLTNDKSQNIDAQAIIAKQVVNDKTYYLITFRGTEPSKIPANILEIFLKTITGKTDQINAGDVLTDLVFPQIQFDGDTKVHAGFLRYTQAVLDDPSVKKMIEEIRNQPADSKYEVLVTGHSLGGAAAGVFSAFLQKEGIAEKHIKTVTFAAPVPGNKAFTDRFLNDAVKVEIASDGVPGAPTISNIFGSEYDNTYGEKVTMRLVDSKELEKRREEIRQLRQQLSQIPSWNRPGRKIVEASLNILMANDITQTLKEAAIENIPVLRTALSHNEYPAIIERNYNRVRGTEITPSWSLVGYMQNNLTAITQGGSTHIGSAAYYLGSTANSEKLTIEKMATEGVQKVEQFSGARVPSAQQLAEYTAPGSITNLTAPVDITLNWDQSASAGRLDLDSHLTGPSALGADSSVRFHIRYDERGNLNSAPNALLYRDVIPQSGGSGPEQTRIQDFPENRGIYRFYVHDFTNRDIIDSPALAAANPEVAAYYSGNRNLPEGQNLGTPLGGAIKAPTDRLGNVWYVFQLDSRTGILKRVNVPFINESDRSRVPRIGEDPSKILSTP
jgi:hypothetical protein